VRARQFPAPSSQGRLRAVHHSAGQWAGVALLARARSSSPSPCVGLAGEPVPSEARWCEATIAGIRFASTYVPNGRTLDSPEFPRKLAFLDAVAERAAARGRRRW
jgi:exodeoxyribonuclease-3